MQILTLTLIFGAAWHIGGKEPAADRGPADPELLRDLPFRYPLAGEFFHLLKMQSGGQWSAVGLSRIQRRRAGDDLCGRRAGGEVRRHQWDAGTGRPRQAPWGSSAATPATPWTIIAKAKTQETPFNQLLADDQLL